MSHEEKLQDEKDLREILDNYRTVRKLGKWAVGIVVFVGAFLYALIELRKFIMPR